MSKLGDLSGASFDFFLQHYALVEYEESNSNVGFQPQSDTVLSTYSLAAEYEHIFSATRPRGSIISSSVIADCCISGPNKDKMLSGQCQ